MVKVLQELFYIDLTPIVIWCTERWTERASRSKDISAICWKNNLARGLTKHKQLHRFFILAFHIIRCDNKAVIEPTVSPHQLPNLKVCIWKAKKKTQAFPPTPIEWSDESTGSVSMFQIHFISLLRRGFNLIQNITAFSKNNRLRTLWLWVGRHVMPQRQLTLQVRRAEGVTDVDLCPSYHLRLGIPTVFMLCKKGLDSVSTAIHWR